MTGAARKLRLGLALGALAACQGTDGKARLFLGADDEDYGGAIRPLP